MPEKLSLSSGILMFSLCPLLLSGCSSAPSGMDPALNKNHNPAPAQVSMETRQGFQAILSVRSGILVDADLLRVLGARIDAPLYYVRPVTANVHVIRILAPTSQASVLMRRLAGDPRVVAVQPDLFLQPQRSGQE